MSKNAEFIEMKKKLNQIKAKKSHSHYIQQRSRARRFVNNTMSKMLNSKDRSTAIQGGRDFKMMFKLMDSVARQHGMRLSINRKGDNHNES